MYVIRVYACVVVMMLCMSCGTPEADRESALEDSYALLDAEIARSGVYEKEKEDRIGRLRLQCAGEDDEQLRTDIINVSVRNRPTLSKRFWLRTLQSKTLCLI